MPVWRNPAAWLGLTALAIPIIVHLLARMRAQVIAFPSLRFIDVSRLAARKRRTLSDLPLLAVRLLALLLAVAACANPLFLTSSRRAAWSARVSRAIVIDSSTSADAAAATAIAEKETQDKDTVRATVVRSESLPDGVARALVWLRTAPPSRREIVLVSTFQAESVTAALLRDVPDDVGLRFMRAARLPHERTTTARAVSTRGPNGTFPWSRAEVHLDDRTTAITARALASTGVSSSPPPIAITASADGVDVTPFGLHVSAPRDDRAATLATIEAVLAEGVPAPAPASAEGRRVELHLGAVASTAPSAGADARAGASASVAADASLLPASQLTPVATPWMADLLHRLAEDRTLAVGVGTVASADSAAGAASVNVTPWHAIVSDANGVPLVLAAARASKPEALILAARVPVVASGTPLLVRSVLRAMAGPDTLPAAEVRTISDAALRTWTRPAAEPSTDALRNVEDSDRRWFWGAVLVLLLIETWMRRDRQARARARLETVEAHEHAA